MVKNKNTDVVNKNSFICINCECKMKQLHRIYGNITKVIVCHNCHMLADKYIENEAIVLFIDLMLLSKSAYRHILYNTNFKLFWKLSVVLLLLESFTLWRQKCVTRNTEQSFYNCCFQNIADWLLCTCLYFILSRRKSNGLFSISMKQYAFIMLKANTLANLSKFFLLPVTLWRENTTDFGSISHRFLVINHYLYALLIAYSIVSHSQILRSALVVLPVYFAKEFMIQKYTCSIWEL